jgi:hypothetical protein
VSGDCSHGHGYPPQRNLLASRHPSFGNFAVVWIPSDPISVVQGHTEEEVRSILVAFEDIYRSQFPDLQLGRWTRSIFTWLTHATLDPDGSKRVTMDHLSRLVTSTLRQTYEQGATDVDASALQATTELMILRRDAHHGY